MTQNTRPLDRTLDSPCISVCALDENDLCIGCQRSASEIARWSSMTAEQKRDVLSLVAKREQKMIIGGHS